MMRPVLGKANPARKEEHEGQDDLNCSHRLGVPDALFRLGGRADSGKGLRSSGQGALDLLGDVFSLLYASADAPLDFAHSSAVGHFGGPRAGGGKEHGAGGILRVAMMGTVIAAVHHAETVAHRVGEPFERWCWRWR